ncbi:GGDEF domain-containing protein [Listeria monocytogenes]|nr:GGDEF domain-containing protein [Listeria monocytogenes]ECW0260960.1 GGDEF domain-containing protein [Listeria monocytogenes]ECW0280248.1 GGDEF domain-containing protein [Listeria monocytogenes]EKI9003062.1 GGDEF domain-containing protein [Listeria monocytogenes]
MKKITNNLFADIGFLFFILLCFITIGSMINTPDEYLRNIILLNITFLLVIITYFTNLTLGLILNVLYIFIYATYIIYEIVANQIAYGFGSYFWLIITPLFTVASAMFTRNTSRLQEENTKIKQQNLYLGTIDQETLLKNIVSFQNDERIFSSISRRYDLPLSLMVIKVRHWRELKRFQSEEEMRLALQDISAILETCIRTSDVLYLLDKDDATWGLLLLTDEPGGKLVADRIKSRIAEANTEEFAAKYRVKLELRIGTSQFDSEKVKTPLDFIDLATKELEYDV